MSAPLDNLHDFYQPPPPVWTPQTPGWYVLFALAGLTIIGLATHFIRRWLANRYRREALRELALLTPQRFSELLKRTALTVWPREKIASLSGPAWIEFLNKSSHKTLFSNAPADRIEEIAIKPQSISLEDEQALRQVAAVWIRRHRVQA